MSHKDLSTNQRIKILIDEYSRLTQRAFAEKIGVSQSAISSLFSQRENRPGLEMLQKIAIAYPEVSLDWLLVGRGQMLQGLVQESTQQLVERALASQEQALKKGDLVASEMAILELRQLNARLHGEDVEHPHVLKARADAEQDAHKQIYSVADEYPYGPNSQLSVRLGISEAMAKQLVVTGKIRSIDVGKEGYRTSEYAVREFLKEA